MTRLRKHVRDNYTVIDNALLSDESLSFRARGVAAFLLSKPDDWLIKLDYLAKLGSEGKAAIRTAMQELAAAGYLTRERIRRPDGTLATVTHLANYPAFLEIGTPSTRAMGYEPKCQETEVRETDISETDTSENRSSEAGGVLPSTELPSTENQVVGGIQPTNQPTDGDEPPKQPEPPANNPPLEAKAVALLIDPSVGVAMPKAKALAEHFPFAEIRRQVFGWLPEFRRGGVKVPALIHRIENSWACSEPDPDVDRALWNRYRTAVELEADAQAEAELAEMLDRPSLKPRPKPPAPSRAPSHDDPWAIAVAELSTCGQFADGLLERAAMTQAGKLGESEIWEITLDARDAREFSWMQDRGAVLIRKTLASILGRAVLVDVVMPAAVPA